MFFSKTSMIFVRKKNKKIGYASINSLKEGEIIEVWNGTRWYETSIEKNITSSIISHIFSDGCILDITENDQYILNTDRVKYPDPISIFPKDDELNNNVYNTGYHNLKKIPHFENLRVKIEWLSGIIDKIGNYTCNYIILNNTYPLLHNIKYLLANIGIHSVVYPTINAYNTEIDNYFYKDEEESIGGKMFSLKIYEYYARILVNMGLYSNITYTPVYDSYIGFHNGKRNIRVKNVYNHEQEVFGLKKFKGIVVNDMTITLKT